MALQPADRDRRIVADHLSRHLRDDLWDDRVHLARHDRRALLELGQEDLREPGARPGAEETKVVGDLRQADGDGLERAGGLDEPVAGGLALERIRRRGDGQPRVGREVGAHAGRELRMRVQPGADRRPAERDLAEPRERRLDPRPALTHLSGVAAELLAERDGHRIHPVRAAGLDDVGELGRLRLQGGFEPLERRQQVVDDLVEGRQVDRGREDVVRALAHVDVVVRVHVLAREGGDHLVRVHVRRGARAGLEDVDRELIVELAVRDPVGRGRDPLRAFSSSRRPSSPFTSAAADLIRPSQRATGVGIGSPETGKLAIALRVSPPQNSGLETVSVTAKD